MFKILINKIKFIFNKKAPEIKSVVYAGFKVFYSDGTSIIKRFLSDGEYEPRVISCTEKILNKVTNPIVLDVGANIGLFSLAVLKIKPQSQIFAFEPGPHQFSLLAETVKTNNLNNNIKLFQIALCNKNGSSNFRVHDSQDASGDGFIDTERAGKTKKITVLSQTLDTWLQNNSNLKSVDLIKMDTEGSEFWILNGAFNFFKEFKPAIIMEIYPMNIKNYPFEISDLVIRIEDLGYKIYTLERVLIPFDEIEKYLGVDDTFLLLHKTKLNA